MALQILADENMPHAAAYFHAGRTSGLPPACNHTPARPDADLLLVRSVTRVNAALLQAVGCVLSDGHQWHRPCRSGLAGSAGHRICGGAGV